MADLECSALWERRSPPADLSALLDFELDLLPLIQRFVTIALNGGEMDEYILARLALNKTKTFSKR